MTVKFKKLKENAKIPTYGSPYAAGADLYSAEDGDICIEPGQTAMIHTGIAIELPGGVAGLVYARSGMACKRGLAPANKVGVIDSDYRGELIIALHNHGTQPQTVATCDRIAQLVITPCFTAEFVEADELSQTVRGDGGFGSTGTK